MYTVKNYPTKKALKADMLAGVKIEVYQPGPFAFVEPSGEVSIEGPHYPKPHKWYSRVHVVNGVIDRMVS